MNTTETHSHHKNRKKKEKNNKLQNNNNINAHANGVDKLYKLDKLDEQHKHELCIAFEKSIKINKLFYFTLFICFYMLKKRDTNTAPTSYLGLVFSFLFILLFGHIVHRLSHNINFTNVYNKYKKGNINNYIDSILIKVCNILDFHRVTHHDSAINKKPVNICYEFFNNFLTQGGGLVIFIWFYNWCIDTRVILLWALMYASAHNINYTFLKPTVHIDHHLHEDTNYGLDIADIIFDTKHDLNDIENYNHISINLFVVTAFIVYYF